MSLPALPSGWRHQIGDECARDYFTELSSFVEEERRNHTVFPPAHQTFAALEHTPFDEVRVLVVGQDPYHGEGQAHGLCFSVARGVKIPPSLRNIYKELEEDLGCRAPAHGNLEAWAERGVLLLNTVLTVRSGEAHSHRKKGWERFTDAVISALSTRDTPFVALLWGSPARKKRKLIDTQRHRIVEAPIPRRCPHTRGFFGSRPFSAVNAALEELGHPALDWQLPD